jgi:hypothetical protein
MSEERGFLIGPQLREKLKTTISRVEAMPLGGSVSRIPTRFEEGAPSFTPKPIRIAAYARDTFWRKGEVQEVSFYTHDGTLYGLETPGPDGTANAVNVCNDLAPVPSGIDSPRLGPTPTMTWCVVSESRGGENVVVEGPQAETFIAAYSTSEGVWETGTTRLVEQYFYTDGGYVSTDFFATVKNIGPPYKPLVVSATSGPSSTKAWCVVVTSPDGDLVAVEAEHSPQTQWATIDPEAIGDPWQRTSTRTVTLPNSDETVEVVSAFDYYSPLDLPHGLVFTRGVSPNGEGTANIVIGPSPVPLHSAKYDGDDDWPKDETREMTVLPSAGITSQRTVTVSNPYFDSVEPSDRPMAIGKVGTAYHVITSDQASVKLGTRTDFGDDSSPWLRTSERSVRITGSTSEVNVVSVFDNYTHLDLPFGLAYTKAPDPRGGEGTANVVIGPPPVPLHSATYNGDDDWPKDETREMTVLPSAGITSQRTVTVSNPYFDSVEPSDRPMAIGKVGTAYHVITSDPASVKLGTRTYFGDDSSPWLRTSERSVRITGSTSEVNVVSVFDNYTHLDLPFGLAYTKAPDPRGGEGTANVVIGPPPVPIHSAIYNGADDWERNETRQVTVLPSAGIPHQRTVTVSNPYFDSVEPSDRPMAIGKVGTAYHVITSDPAGVKLARRTEFGDDSSPWLRTSERSVLVNGSNSQVNVVSIFDNYTHLDLPFGLAYTKAPDPRGGEGTANVVIGPPPVPLHSITVPQPGVWARDEEKTVTVLPSAGIQQSRTARVTNPYFDDVEVGTQPMAIGKVGTAFHLITAPSMPGVKFADRTEADQWERGSVRTVKLFGSTVTESVYNFVGHYESFDGRGTGGMPGLAIAKGADLGGSGTAYYAISPPPITFRTGKFSGPWKKGELKTVDLPDHPTGTLTVVNDLISLPAPQGTTTSRFVNIAKDKDQWHLVSFEMAAKTAVFSTVTQTITFIGTGATSEVTFIGSGNTQTITYAAAGEDKTLTYVTSISEIEVVSSVSASLNTSNCQITVDMTKTKIKTANDPTTVTFKTAGSTATATTISLGDTQKATIFSASSTQTVTVVSGTYTATYISLEI